MGTVPQLERVLDGAPLSEGTVLDLSQCSFVDSAAIRLLSQAAREASESGNAISLVVTEPGILRVLEITGMDALLPIHSTVESALAL